MSDICIGGSLTASRVASRCRRSDRQRWCESPSFCSTNFFLFCHLRGDFVAFLVLGGTVSAVLFVYLSDINDLMHARLVTAVFAACFCWISIVRFEDVWLRSTR
jgi:hypothetical protein